MSQQQQQQFHVTSFGDEFAEFQPVMDNTAGQQQQQQFQAPTQQQVLPAGQMTLVGGPPPMLPLQQQQQTVEVFQQQQQTVQQVQYAPVPSQQQPQMLAQPMDSVTGMGGGMDVSNPQEFIQSQQAQLQLPQETMEMLGQAQEQLNLAPSVPQTNYRSAPPQQQVQQQETLHAAPVPQQISPPVGAVVPEQAQAPVAGPAPSAPVTTPSPAKAPPAARRAGRKKKDPSAPASVSSAYAFFFGDTQASVKEHNPNAEFGEVSKIVASMWQGMGEEDKASYKARNSEDKIRFEKEMTEYRAKQEQEEKSNPSEEAQPEPPKRTRKRQPAATPSANNGGGVVLVPGPHGRVSAAKSSAITPEEVPSSSEEESADENVTENICIRQGCIKKAVKNVEWEDEYCSNVCVIEHCKNVFTSWTLEQRV